MDCEALFQEAMALGSQSKFAQASSLYKQLVATAKDPRFFIAYAQCLQQLGHWAESVPLFEQGLELKPHYCESDARLMLAESYMNTGQKNRLSLNGTSLPTCNQNIQAMSKPSMKPRLSYKKTPNISVKAVAAFGLHWTSRKRAALYLQR